VFVVERWRRDERDERSVYFSLAAVPSDRLGGVAARFGAAAAQPAAVTDRVVELVRRTRSGPAVPLRRHPRASAGGALLCRVCGPVRPAFWRLNDDLLGTVISRRLRSRRLRSFDRPVRIVFGDADPYLNRRVAWRLHRLFPTSDLHLLATARHYVQVDEPDDVAQLITSLRTG
jgi:pimeloyl-ACP methyl ester carboxylesterase